MNRDHTSRLHTLPSFIALFLAALALPVTLATASAPETPTASSADVFERFRSLTGSWMGKSTKGWEATMNARVIAKRSTVVMNSFDAHPDEEMLTTLVLDGEDLVLVHYCVARNQPRLVATDISEDGLQVTFTFRDGTNLPSRDQGHMDKAIFRFVDDGSFSSQWTWYQDGKEKWMEEIQYRRLTEGPRGETGSR